VIQWLLAMAPPSGDGPAPNPIVTFLPFVLMIVVVWFLLIRPQRKRAKEQQNMLSSLAKGDRVVTNSGMLGTIVGINEKDNIVTLKVGEETKIEFLKGSIAGKLDQKTGG
jgi:preprotein translocase subunit YajC